MDHVCCKQERLQHVLEEIDPVDLSHVMWAMARFDSYPAPGHLDALLATLPPQITLAEAAVRLPSCAAQQQLVAAVHPALLCPASSHADPPCSNNICVDCPCAGALCCSLGVQLCHMLTSLCRSCALCVCVDTSFIELLCTDSSHAHWSRCIIC